MTPSNPTPPLEGRELDAAVFRALSSGWGDKLSDELIATLFRQPHFGPYSTHPERLPEMLAWLQERAGGLDITWLCDGDPGAKWEAYRAPSSIPQKGATLNQAVARLVVAVAASKEQP
jgi:hypothetical protein